MSNMLQERLSRFRIVVACGPEPDTQVLLRHLQRSRGAVRLVWPIPDRIGGEADLVIADHTKGLAARLPWTPGEADAALLVVLPANRQYALADVQASSPDAVLQRPFAAQDIDMAVMLALDHAGYVKRLRMRIARVEENVRAIRTIEKAKQTLMSLHQIDEERAFHMLRDMAMQKRMTVAGIAGRLVDSADILIYRK